MVCGRWGTAAVLLLRTEITHLSLSQQRTVHLNTIISLVIHRLSARKLPYFSGGQAGSSSSQGKHLPTELPPHCECDGITDEPRRGKVTTPTSTRSVDGNDKCKTLTLILFEGKKKKKTKERGYPRINNPVSACRYIKGTLWPWAYRRLTNAPWRLDVTGKCYQWQLAFWKL